MKRLTAMVIAVGAGIGLCQSALAQDHSGHGVADHSAHQPATPEVQATAPHQHEEVPQPAHDHAAMVEASHEGHDLPPPEVGLRDPHAHSGGYALHGGPYTVFPDHQMDMSDTRQFSGLRMDRMETLKGGGTAVEAWAWHGDSYRRLILKGEAEYDGSRLEEGELDLVSSRAVAPFWNLYAGAGVQAHDEVSRGRAVLGVSGLAPYWFEIDAAFSLDERGRVGFTLEAEYEWLLTQRLILQPRVDLSAYSRDDDALGVGSGLSELGVGLRLRYEFSRRFAPYVGVERVRVFGSSADFLPAGEPRSEERWVAGLRFWF